jgi:F-box domain
MEQLPNETILYILAFLPTMDLIRARLVTKLWAILGKMALKGSKAYVWGGGVKGDFTLFSEVDTLTVRFLGEINRAIWGLNGPRLITIEACYECFVGRDIPKGFEWGKNALCRDCIETMKADMDVRPKASRTHSEVSPLSVDDDWLPYP